MSQLNQNGQSNNNNNNGYHPARKNNNLNHRAQQQQQQQQQNPQYNMYANQSAYAPEYLNAGYPQMYNPYYPGSYYPPPTQFVSVPPTYSPRQGQDFGGQHQLNITTPSGDKVDLRNINSFTPKSSNATLNSQRGSAPTTPKSGNTSTNQINSSSTAFNKNNDKELEALRESFRKQVLARAQKKDAAAAAAASSTSASASPKPATAKLDAPATVPTKVEESSKSAKTTSAPASESSKDQEKVDAAEELKRKFKESVAAKKKLEEEKKSLSSKAATPEPVEAPKAEKTSTATTSAATEATTEKAAAAAAAAAAAVVVPEVAPATSTTEETKPKEEEEKSTSIVSERPAVATEEGKEEASVEKQAESTTDEAKKSEEDQPQDEQPSTTEGTTTTTETTEESSEPKDTYTISKFFERIANAKAIDPYTFEYPENLVKVDPNTKPSSTSQKTVRYNPDFLIQFGGVTNFPLDDEFKERIKFIQIQEKGSNRSFSKGGPSGQFRSGFGQGSIGGGSQFSKSGSSRGKFDLNSRSNSRQNSKRRGNSGRNDRKSNRNRDRESEREPEVPAEPVKPLEKSATRWIPKSRLAKTEEVKYAPDGVTVILSADEVARKVKSLLNKLTLEYFEEISNDIITIANQSQWEETAETLKSVLEFTFAKACDEPHWSSMYAQFCAKMCKAVSDDVKDEKVLDKEGKPTSGGALVRRLLLTRCQAEYTKGWADKLPTNEDGSAIEPDMMTDEYYQAAAAKRRGLGLIRFIGHLYVLGLLSDTIIFICIKDQSSNVEDPSEDTVENLLQLIKTVGPRLDSHPNIALRQRFNSQFAQVELMSQKAKISSRLQFKLLDLVELRNKKKWAGSESEAGPKTISEIHQEAELKKQEEERNSRDRRSQNRNDSRSNSSKTPWGSQRVSSSDIKKVGTVRNSNSTSNLGPINNFNRTKSLRGSSRQSSQNLSAENNSSPSPSVSPLGARENSKKGDTPAGNRFALLNDEEQNHDEDEDDDEEEGDEEEDEEVEGETQAESAASVEESENKEEEQKPEFETKEETKSEEQA